jgi:N-acetylmuramoyl-L-alanine amidase
VAVHSPFARPFFLLRAGVALLSLAGFWWCIAKVESPSWQGGIPPLATAPSSGSGEDFGRDPGSTTPEGPETAPSPPAPTEPESNRKRVVVIDPGHGGADGGTVGNNLLEKDWTLKIGLGLAEELRRRGHEVVLTRETDATIPLVERPAFVNAAPRLALISIHFNAGAADASGVETWYSWPKKPEVMARLHTAEGLPVEGTLADDGQQLALAIQSALTSRTGARDRGIKNRDDLAMTSRTLCPAVLIECGFLSNPAESRRIQEVGYRRKLVLGIADGYEAWLKNRRSIPVLSPSGHLPADETSPTAGDAEH